MFKNKQQNIPKFIFPFIVFVDCVLLDQISKFLISDLYKAPIEITSFFRFLYEKNYGIAFSIAIPEPFVLILNIFLLFVLSIFLANRLDFNKALSRFLFAILLAGAVGNLIDRIRLGYVVDFISFGNFPVFNFADIFITVSIFLIIIFYGRIERVDHKFDLKKIEKSK